MRVLALETSEHVGTLAALQLVEGGNADDEISTVGQLTLPSDQRSAQSLLPAIQSLLQGSGWKSSQLDLICVTVGPGSFTGLRIGVTAAKSLAYATGAQLVEVHTLAAMAAGVSRPYKRMWTILDAQRQELFAAQFEPSWQDRPGNLPPTRIVSVEQWLEELQPGDLVSGPPMKKLADRLPADVEVADPQQWSPRAEIVGRLGIAAYRNGIVTDVMQLVPNYYRKSAAEEKADQQQA